MLCSVPYLRIASSSPHNDIVHFHALGPALFTCLPSIASFSKVVVTCQGLIGAAPNGTNFPVKCYGWVRKLQALRRWDYRCSEELRSYFKRLIVETRSTSLMLQQATRRRTPFLLWHLARLKARALRSFFRQACA